MCVYISVVTADHFSVGDLSTQTVGGLVGVYRHVQYIRRVNIQQHLTDGEKNTDTALSNLTTTHTHWDKPL